MYISRQINAQNQIFNDDEFRDDERSLEIIAREGNEHGRKRRKEDINARSTYLLYPRQISYVRSKILDAQLCNDIFDPVVHT